MKNSKFNISCFVLMFISFLMQTTQVSAYSKTTRHVNQDITAYVSEAGKPTASGSLPESLDVAVHPENYYVNDWNHPVLPFGTVIITDKSILKPNSIYSDVFYVRDTGQLNNQDNLSRYWFDIWAGSYSGNKYNSTNYWNAVGFGKQVVSYTAYWP